MAGCTLCPRQCGVDREGGERGVCGMPATPLVARASLHRFEEPCLCGTRGSGTVFFSGCSLGCIFCQNRAISRPQGAHQGRAVDPEALCEIMLGLQQQGAHNINLVTATHFADQVAKALALAGGKLQIPVVYNCGGYERVETLRLLDGLVDIYLPDFKYASPTLAAALSGAADYAEVAAAALSEMHRQVGAVRFSEDGLLQGGLMVRHLVLPGSRRDSVAVLERIASLLPVGEILLSLMRQYTPDFAPPEAPRALHRRVTTFEYETVREAALRLGFAGYSQEAGAASADFTPDFHAAD